MAVDEKGKVQAAEAVGAEALVIVESLGSIKTIANSEDRELASILWEQGQEMLKKIDEGYDDLIKSAHKLHKDLVAKKKKYSLPVEEACAQIKRAILTFDTRIKQEAERLRVAEEKKKQEEAKALIEEGKVEEAVERLQSTTVSAPAAPKPEGGPRFQKRWHAEVIDFKLLPDEYKLPNTVLLNTLAVQQHEKFSIPGAKAVEEEK
jgi:hypothetical protein